MTRSKNGGKGRRLWLAYGGKRTPAGVWCGSVEWVSEDQIGGGESLVWAEYSDVFCGLVKRE